MMCALIKRIRDHYSIIFENPVYDFTVKLIGYEESEEHFKHRKKILLKRKGFKSEKDSGR